VTEDCVTGFSQAGKKRSKNNKKKGREGEKNKERVNTNLLKGRKQTSGGNRVENAHREGCKWKERGHDACSQVPKKSGGQIKRTVKGNKWCGKKGAG